VCFGQVCVVLWCTRDFLFSSLVLFCVSRSSLCGPGGVGAAFPWWFWCLAGLGTLGIVVCPSRHNHLGPSLSEQYSAACLGVFGSLCLRSRWFSRQFLSGGAVCPSRWFSRQFLSRGALSTQHWVFYLFFNFSTLGTAQ
jgi:hypothetical protein